MVSGQNGQLMGLILGFPSKSRSTHHAARTTLLALRTLHHATLPPRSWHRLWLPTPHLWTLSATVTFVSSSGNGVHYILFPIPPFLHPFDFPSCLALVLSSPIYHSQYSVSLSSLWSCVAGFWCFRCLGDITAPPDFIFLTLSNHAVCGTEPPITISSLPFPYCQQPVHAPQYQDAGGLGPGRAHLDRHRPCWVWQDHRRILPR